MSSGLKRAAAALAIAVGISVAGASSTLLTVAEFEGLRTSTYKDIVGVQTVCYGSTDPKWAIPGATYTAEECLQLLTKDLIEHSAPLLDCMPGLAASEDMFMAFSSLAINIGVPRTCRSTAAKRFNEGQYFEACEALRWWDRAGGKVIPGLVNRRTVEYNICIQGAKSLVGGDE